MTRETQDGLLQLFETAIALEKRGYAHYKEIVENTKNPLGRELFASLRDDELVHMQRIQRIREAVERGESRWKDAYEVADAATTPSMLEDLFARMDARRDELAGPEGVDADDLRALEHGIAFELETVQFYEGQLAQAKDPLVRAFVERMIAEERFHHQALVDTRLFLTEPEAWHREQEKGGLDGA